MRAQYMLILSLGLFFLPSFSQRIQGEEIKWQTNLKQAAQQARTQEKAMLIQIGASWCGFCHKMEKETYRNQGVVKHVNSCFIPVSVDADKNEELVEAIGVSGLPTTVIITPQLKIVKKISGYVAAQEMEGHLNKICLVKHEPTVQTRSRQKIQKMSQQQVKAQFAFKNICLVSMLDEQLLFEGTPQFSSTYKGRKVCFVSAKHKKKFESNPDRYWPAFEGKCRVSQLEKNHAVDGDPHAGGVYRERLVFFHTETERDRFSANPAQYILNQ